jgi:aspartyl-tRNA synthetase
MALGLDRVTAMILGTPSIREVIAFPKNRSAFCPLTQAPSTVSEAQLAELGLLDRGGPAPSAGTRQDKDPIEVLSWVSRIGVSASEREAIRTAVDQAKMLAQKVREAAQENNAADNAPLFSVLPGAKRFRPGHDAKICDLSETGELIKNAPSVKGGYFKVAPVLE